MKRFALGLLTTLGIVIGLAWGFALPLALAAIRRPVAAGFTLLASVLVLAYW